jgi:hypothetical protein
MDFGVQQGAEGDASSTWYGGALIGRYQVSPKVAVAGRVERYADRDQVIIVTGTTAGFRAWGGSIDLDVAPTERVVWRTEVRGFTAADRIFPDRDATGGLAKGNGFIVTSLAATF